MTVGTDFASAVRQLFPSAKSSRKNGTAKQMQDKDPMSQENLQGTLSKISALMAYVVVWMLSFVLLPVAWKPKK